MSGELLTSIEIRYLFRYNFSGFISERLVLCVEADEFQRSDDLSSDRAYLKGQSQKKYSNMINTEAGKHFEPKVVTLFLQFPEQGKI